MARSSAKDNAMEMQLNSHQEEAANMHCSMEEDDEGEKQA